MSDPATDSARGILRFGYTALPIAAGADKFLNILTDWEKYVAPWMEDLLPLSPDAFMMIIGVVEIAAGILVAVRPRVGAAVVAVWLAGITLSLLTVPEYWDVALRDLGLALGALALFQLSSSRAAEPAGA